MSQQYASKQPSGFKNHVENIAIVGAGGRVGKFFAEHLLKTGKHKVTAITRADGGSGDLPSGVDVKRVNYDDPSTLIEALRGQDVLIITMAVMAPPDTHSKLVKAAAEAKVPWVFPNEYGVGGGEKPELERDVAALAVRNKNNRKEIEELGASNWIGFACGFWYEFSAAGGPDRYGIDFDNKTMVYVDDGTTKIHTSTWPQCGRAMANLLSLKVLPDDENDKTPCLDMFRNRFVFISSFYVNQKDMFESVLRVTGTNTEDWKVSYEGHKERYESGVKDMQQGDMRGFARLLYTRVLYPDESGSFSELHNDLLGLPEEDFDEYTKLAVQMQKDKVVPY